MAFQLRGPRQRRTLKRRLQEGGGTFFSIKTIKGVNNDDMRRKNALEAAIRTSALLETSVQQKIMRWFGPKWGIYGERTDPVGATEADKIQNCTADIETWVAGIENQDAIFDIVTDVLCDVYDGKTEAAIMEGAKARESNKKAAMKYIQDIVQFLTFLHRPKTAVAVTLPSKMDLIQSDETLSTLLYFPKRLNNIFIQSLANILILLKHDAASLADLRDAARQKIVVQKYRSNMLANVYLLTGYEFRDGFFLDHQKSQFDTIQKDFWEKLFAELAKERLTPINIRGATTQNWYQITNYVFRWYQTTSFNGSVDHKPALLKFFDDNLSMPPPLLGVEVEEREYLPPESYDTIPIYGTTLKQILAKMQGMVLEFILHLAHTIRKNEAATIAAIKAQGKATTPGSGAPTA
jgi:hypothetical protein